MNKTALLAAVSGTALAGLSNAAILDNFTAPFTSPPFVGVAAGADFTATLADGSVLGGERDIVLSPDSFGVSTAALFPGVLSIGNGAGAFSTLTITLDNFSGVDLTASGDSVFQIDFALVQGEAEVSFFVNGDSLGTETISGTNTPDIASFGFGGAESSTDSLTLVVRTTQASTDYLIDSVQTVIPEPASAALAALGALIISGRRRRP